MFLVLWEFEVKPGSEERFVQVYSSGGDWDSLFRSDPNHRGTRLFQDTARTGVYLTADYWLSQKSYEEFLALRRSEYKALDAATEDLTLSERHIGSLEVNDASATVLAKRLKPSSGSTKQPGHRRQDQA